MSVDSQTFTTEQLVEYSKTVLVEMPCDWGNCPAVLNCWDNMVKVSLESDPISLGLPLGLLFATRLFESAWLYLR